MIIRIVKHIGMFQFVVLLCLSGLVHGENPDIIKLLHKNERIFPAIGRLFRADIPVQVDTSKNEKYGSNLVEKITKLSPLNEGSLTDYTHSGVKSVRTGSVENSKIFRGNYEEQLYDTIESKTFSPRKRYKRSKGIILSGTKIETDYNEDKNKKREYEFRKKSAFRGNIKQKRMKRSADSAKGTNEKELILQNKNLNGTKKVESIEDNNVNISKPTTDYSKFNRKDYAQKLFQRKVEALFDINSDNDSSLSHDEIEKSKTIRKQLLNFYVKGKEKNTLALLHNRSVQDENKEPITSQNKDGKMLPPYFRMNIDVPVGDIEDLLEEEDSENSGTNIEGRGRRRRLIRRILIPLLVALKLKLAIVLPLIFGLVTLIAFKGLWAGMTSLGVVSALALKSLINGQKIFYEIRAPHHFHYPPVGHEIQYHHSFPEYWSRREDSYKPVGGWSNLGITVSKMDHEISNWDNDSEYADQDQNQRSEKQTDKTSSNCTKSSEGRQNY